MTGLPYRDHPEPVTATVPICLHGASGTSPVGVNAMTGQSAP
jgi:hypothetical protein